MILFFAKVYAMCPAVLRSLMYSVSSEINGEGDIESGYTLNVMFNGFVFYFCIIFCIENRLI